MSGNPANLNITAEKKAISDEFIEILSNMFGIIDEVSEKIGDGAYLELANQFKQLHKFKDKMKANVIYVEHERRTHMRIRRNTRTLTLAEKLANKKKYIKCERCDCVITKKEYCDHQNRRKCKNIYSSRMITLATKMRVSKEGLIIIDNALGERDGHYYIGEGAEKKKGNKIFTIADYYEEQINHENKSATKIQAFLRGYKIRKNVKIYDGVGELPNFIKTDGWRLFKSAWLKAGKIPIYRLSEYWRRIRHPTDDEKRHKRMFDVLKAVINHKRTEKNKRILRRTKKEWLMVLKKCDKKTEFHEVRKLLQKNYSWIKIKSITKRDISDIYMDIAKQMFD